MAGSRDGLILLVQHRRFGDDELAPQLTLKRYRSEKAAHEDGTWRHRRVVLEPMSDDSSYEQIVFEGEEVEELQVLGELAGYVLTK